MRISDWSSDVCSSDVSRDPASLDQRARPQRALDILEQFAVQFLPPEPRAAIKPVHRRQPLRRQIVAIVPRAPARRFDALFLQDRKSVVSGKSVSVRVDSGVRRILKKKKIE